MRMDVTANTDRTRVNKMKRDGVLDIVGMMGPKVVSRHRVVILIGVKRDNTGEKRISV